MQIEILYFDGCPHHVPAVERVRGVLSDMGVEASVIEVAVSEPGMATQIGFLGSPSVRVDGLDVEPAARGSDQIGYGCRTYVNGGRREGLPSVELIRAALEEVGSGDIPGTH